MLCCCRATKLPAVRCVHWFASMFYCLLNFVCATGAETAWDAWLADLLLNALSAAPMDMAGLWGVSVRFGLNGIIIGRRDAVALSSVLELISEPTGPGAPSASVGAGAPPSTVQCSWSQVLMPAVVRAQSCRVWVCEIPAQRLAPDIWYMLENLCWCEVPMLKSGLDMLHESCQIVR